MRCLGLALSLLLLLSSPTWATVNVVRFPSGTPVQVCQPSDTNTNCGGGGTSGVSSFNARTGAVTLSSSDVTTAVGSTTYDAYGAASAITLAGLGGTTLAAAEAAITPTELGLVIGTNVLAQRTFGTAANNNTGDFLASGKLGTVTSTDFCHGDGSGNVTCVDGNTYVTGTPWTGLYLPLGGGTLTGNLTLSTHNIVTDTTTGTDIGTGATQKVGFFGATPVVQQSATNVCTSLNNLGLTTGCTEQSLSGYAPLATPVFTTNITTPIVYGGSAAGSTLTLQGTSNGSPSNAYVILQPSGGNVGIGTTSPNATLTVGANLSGTALGSTFITNAGTLGGTAGNSLTLANIGFTSSNISSLGVRAYRTATGGSWNTTAITLGMDVDNTLGAGGYLSFNMGNVGIGTTSPNAGLDMGASNNIRIPVQKSASGVRYVCIDTNGQLTSQAVACVGT
jgi:hypothetical protein